MRHNTQSSAGKSGGPFFTLSELLAMPDLKSRGYEEIVRRVTYMEVGEREQYLVEDANGNKVPPPPGEVVSILELPADHPVNLYIAQRDLDPELLAEQFRCGFCTREYPESKAGRIFYPRLPGGWKDTPQGRLIFYADQLGVQQNWQARYLELVSDDGLTKYALHPYANTWDVKAVRATRSHPWIDQGYFAEVDEDGDALWTPAKYRTAKHSMRNHTLMGLDAAVRNIERSTIPYCVVTEGPADAAKFGPGGVAIIGKSMSEMQANILAQYFELIIFAFDNDEAGQGALDRARRVLAENPESQFTDQFIIPREFKDAGEMAQQDVIGDLDSLLMNY